LNLLDRWLSNVESDHSSRPLATKVLADRPSAAVDSCAANDQQITDQQVCRDAQLWNHVGNPRMVAGEGLADNIEECQLKPLDRNDYNVTFTDAEWATLQRVFPIGVCDWNLPSVGYQPVVPWMTYQDTSGHPIYGGRPLGQPPVATTFGPRSAQAQARARHRDIRAR
jgi:hypothetical protein